MTTLYQDYFETLKKYLLLLQVDQKTGIAGCNDEEIRMLQNQKGPIPAAYEAYLRSMGKRFLFEFMNAENMAFDDLDYTNAFAKDVFAENALPIETDFFVISERRNEYISLIYADEDNPKVWIMSEYWDEDDKGENLSVRANRFTDLFNSFFCQTLNYQTAGFHFVSEDIKDPDACIEEKYQNWFKSLKAIKNIVDTYDGQNLLINELHQQFLDYYLPNETYITGELNGVHSHEKTTTPNDTEMPEMKKKKNIFEKLKGFFS